MGRRLIGRTRKKAKIKAVKTAGMPIIQNALIPCLYASSVETKRDVAPNQDAAIVKYIKYPESFLEAKKKSSRFFILLEKTKLTKRRKKQYPKRKNKNSNLIKDL